jgi:hypothetical protein
MEMELTRGKMLVIFHLEPEGSGAIVTDRPSITRRGEPQGGIQMVDANATFEKLAQSAEILNSKTDEINAAIAAFEAKLVALKIGIELWIEDPDTKFFDPDSTYSLKIERKTINDERAEYTVAFFGFARIDKAWRLAVKRELITHRVDEDDRNETIWENHEIDRFPLANVPRNYRIKALGMFEQLLGAINVQMGQMLDSIERGKNFVKSID